MTDKCYRNYEHEEGSAQEHNGVNSKRSHGPNADVIRRYIQQEKKQNSKNNYFILKNNEKTNTKTNKNVTLKINGS